MYYGKKKQIIIGIIVAVVVIILATLGVVLATQTDLFKSNQSLFWKYAFAYPEETNTLSQITEVYNNLKVEPYQLKSELTLGSSDADLEKILSLFQIEINAQADNNNDYAHANTKVFLSNENLFEVDAVKDKDVFGIKSDDIVTAYLGIKNENINVLSQKVGLTGVSGIPSQISEDQINNYTKLFKISEEDKLHITETYKDVILNNISDKNYTKQTNAVIKIDRVEYTTTAYRLDLSAEEVYNVLVNALETLKIDSRTLDLIYQKAILLGIDKNNISIEQIKEAISNIIDKLQEVELNDIAFVVYNYKGENIQTEILIKNRQKYTINKDAGRLILKVEDLTGNSDISTMIADLEYKTTTTQTSATIKLLVDDIEMFELNISNSGSASQGYLTTDIDGSFMLSKNSEAIVFNYSQKIEIVDEIDNMIKLSDANCAILNNYTKEQMQGLLQALIERIQVVFTEKSQIIDNLMSNNTAINRTQQQIEQNTTDTQQTNT